MPLPQPRLVVYPDAKSQLPGGEGQRMAEPARAAPPPGARAPAASGTGQPARLVGLGDLHADREVIGESVLVNRLSHATERLRPFVLAGEGAGEAQNLHRFGLRADGRVLFGHVLVD